MLFLVLTLGILVRLGGLSFSGRCLMVLPSASKKGLTIGVEHGQEIVSNHCRRQLGSYWRVMKEVAGC